jgi:hypothetical protein
MTFHHEREKDSFEETLLAVIVGGIILYILFRLPWWISAPLVVAILFIVAAKVFE